MMYKWCLTWNSPHCIFAHTTLASPHMYTHTHTHTHKGWSHRTWSHASWSCTYEMNPHIHYYLHPNSTHTHQHITSIRGVHNCGLQQLMTHSHRNWGFVRRCEGVRYVCVGVWGWYEWVANGDSTNYYNYNRFFNLVMTLHVSCNTGRAIKHISLQIVMSLPWQPACWWWVRFSTHKVSHEHTIHTGCHGIITTCAE